MRSVIGLAVLVAMVGAAGGCSSDSSSPLTTAPSTPLTSDTFPGTVPVLGSDVHSFTASQAGEVDVTLTAAGPPSTISVGLAIGSLVAAGSSTCLPLSGAATTAQASSTPQLTGTLAAGSYCVMVFDIGNQTDVIMYSVTVKHP
jgi:hypothetical protein